MSHCPSCGRYVGPHGDEACPYCGARLTGRISIRAVKIAAILLATVGLTILWLAATRAEVPLVAIEQAGATMNLAYVRLEGRCTRAPSYDPENDYLGFWIEDDTGEMYVMAYRAETRQMIEQGRVPAPGDRVEVAGTLRVREDFLSLTVNVPEQLNVTRAEPVERAIGAITPEDQYARVRVQGQVRQVYEPYEGLTLLTIRDETGSIPIAVSEDLIAISGFTPTLTMNQSVEVVGSVSLYGDAPQLVPASTADIAPLDYTVPIAAQRFIVELTSADVGQWVIVRGIVTEVNPFSAGVKLALEDGSGTITALLWQDVYAGLRNNRPEPEIGAEVQVQGELSQYRGELEIVPELSEDVQVTVAATSIPDPNPISKLTTADVGRWVSLGGTPSRPEFFSDVTKFTLDDGTGQIVLLMQPHVYESISEELGAGAQIVLVGQVIEYEGELALTEFVAGKVHVIKAGEAPQPIEEDGVELVETAVLAPTDTSEPTRTPSPAVVSTREPTPTPASTPTPKDIPTPIEAITTDRVGEEATVEGAVVGAASFSAGFKFTLDDGTGQIVLLMWHEVYDDCWDALEINLGAKVRAAGEISQYEGVLQIQPNFGGDVEAIESATAWAAPREIGSLSGGDEGQRVMIEGNVIRVEGGEGWAKIFVGDETGEVVVFLWRNALDRIPDNVALGTEGSRVRVVGAVEVYRSNLEIVPTLPSDVTVLEMP